MKKLLVFALMFCFVTLQYAQTITGKLVDQNGSGLAGLQLKLYISPKTYDAASDSDGSFTFNNITDVKEKELPSGYSISENYPNPFNPKTRIGITIPNSGKVKIDIYNVLGQKVTEAIDKALNTGTNYLDIELAGLPNGIYLAHITLDDKYTMIKKLMLMYGSQHLASSQSISNFSFKKSALATILDSLIVTGTSISKAIFKSLPSMVGNTLNLGSLTVTLPSPTAPTLLSPSNLSIDQSITPTLNWNTVTGATSYTLQVSTTNNFSSYVFNQSGLTVKSQQISSLNNWTKYYWRVSATNKYGTSSYSDVWSFTTIGTTPQQPTLEFPVNNAADQQLELELKWNAVTNAESYLLQVSTNSAFNTFVYNQSNLTSTNQQLSGLSNLTTYYWRVAAINKYGSSLYSNAWSFTTIGSAPSPPTLSLPNDGANDQITDLILSWNAVAGTASYTLQVSANIEFSSFVYNQSEITSTSKQITGLTNSTKYYWRVNATSKYGTSSYSSIWSFTTGTPPSTPTLASPTDLAVEIPLTITLYWNVSSGATSYTLQVSTNSQFSSYVINQSGLTNTNKQISGLSYFTKYYWRVRGAKGSFNSDWSQVWSFNTAGTTPQTPTLISPTNASTNISISPTLSWNQGQYATSYSLQVSTNSSFSSFVYNQSGLNATNQIATVLSNSITYYWRVRAENSYGSSSWSNTWSFTTIITFPQTPTLSLPIDATNRVSISPTLYWNISAGATSYTLQVSEVSDFSTFVYNQSGLINTNQAINGLSNSTTYYWRINATNNYGASSWSNYWSFTTIEQPCPGTPTVLYEGKTYNTVQLGDQCWLKENLDVGTIVNGNQDQINNNGTIEKYCYDNDANNCATYGGLYQWAEAVQYKNGATNTSSPSPAFSGHVQGICPSGWHIPSKAEFDALNTAVNRNSNALKAIGQGTGSGAGTDASGFSALLAGVRASLGSFSNLGVSITLWSSTEYQSNTVYVMDLPYFISSVRLLQGIKLSGFSVRCVKD